MLQHPFRRQVYCHLVEGGFDLISITYPHWRHQWVAGLVRFRDNLSDSGQSRGIVDWTREAETGSNSPAEDDAPIFAKSAARFA
jgi:hypothetical protein